MNLGYAGLFLGSMIASTIIPFSADFVLVGMLAAGSNVVLTVVLASLGNWVGGLISYWMGYAGKWHWMEKWFHVKPETLAKQKAKVDKYGSWLALFSWLPFVGDLFPIALGFYRANFWSCALFMLIGKTARFIGWAVIVKWIQPLFA